MKKILNVAIAVAIVATALTGCKKGANDPFISLKSRKARLKGDWKVVKIEGMDKTTSSSGTTFTTYNYDGTTMIETDETGSSDSYILEMTISFDSKGTFKSMTKNTYPDNSWYKDETEGQWAFVGKNKDAGLKNKEAIIFHNTKEVSSYNDSWGSGTSTNTYSGDFDFAVYDTWILDKLSSKEMVVKYQSKEVSTGGSSTTYETDMTITLEKQ